MKNPGKLVIVGMIVVAVVAAAFSTWYHYRSAHHSLDFWGTTSAVLITGAEQVRIMQLDSAEPETAPDAEGEPAAVEFGGRSWTVQTAKAATAAPGLTNIRRALVQDTTFDWTRPPGADEPEWQYALEFSDGRNWATVLFDFDSDRIALTGARKTALLDRAASDEMRLFFLEQFSETSASPPAESPSESPTAAPDAPADEKSSAKPDDAPADKAGETDERKPAEKSAVP